MQHQQARKALNQLRRANDGELGPLYKTLALTYGRVGKRRHELMQPLLPAEGQRAKSIEEGSGGGDSRAAAQKGTEPEPPPIGRKRNTKPVPELTPQLRALLSSQLSASPPAISRSELHQTRTLKPQIPEVNSWMRPMPQVRVANMTRRWYAEALDRVLPPLPLRDWVMLRDLATGKQSPGVSPPRRRAAGAQRLLSERRISKSLEDLVLFNKITRPPAADKNVHAITPRFMQRMYAKLFSECSLMESHDGQWKATWGHNAMVPGHGRL
ncbi:hypothetical protein TI39_contig285g00053 [Zymoseptoria brevis]|uniref:LYR motif-containing protein Cup1-like N-terminal domain-containing protein n=1 Tax=Zymoseptoria brevis TaxID=1047168 RepID=A0A0F4GWI7_9PEZI|nr:hypothetical protein TI39_contig285g00053 [Zymoseptoria brevis]